MASAIGIQKGKPFNPSPAQKALLTEAVAIGNATARSICLPPGPQGLHLSRQGGYWQTGFPEAVEYLVNGGNGGRDMDGRTLFFYLATVNTPAMALELPGVGSQYAFSSRDSSGATSMAATATNSPSPPTPGRTLLVICGLRPANPLDAAERGNALPHRNNKRNTDMVENADGSITLYFGPEAPEGLEANWVKTVPGRVVRHLPPLRPRPGVV